MLAKTVLCFVGDGQPFVSEMARVLRPGGRFVIGELNKWSSWAAQRRLRAWLGSALWRRGRFRTPGELRALAQAAGLEVETVWGAVYYPRLQAAARFMARYRRPLRPLDDGRRRLHCDGGGEAGNGQPLTSRISAAQRSSIGRMVSSFSDGRLTQARTMPSSR